MSSIQIMKLFHVKCQYHWYLWKENKKKNNCKNDNHTNRIQWKKNLSKFEHYICMKIIQIYNKNQENHLVFLYFIENETWIFSFLFEKTIWLWELLWTNKCDCDNFSLQSSAHILLKCEKYDFFEFNWHEKLDIYLSLSDLLCTKKEVELIIDFFSKTEIVRWSWFFFKKNCYLYHTTII